MFSIWSITTYFTGHWGGQSSSYYEKCYHSSAKNFLGLILEIAIIINFEEQIICIFKQFISRVPSKYYRNIWRYFYLRLNKWRQIFTHVFGFTAINSKSRKLGTFSWFDYELHDDQGDRVRSGSRMKTNSVTAWKAPLFERGLTRWWWKWTEVSYYLFDMSLQMSKRGRIIFAMGWSGVTPLFNREIIPA